MLKQLISKTGNFNKFLTSIENGDNISVFGLGINEKIATIKECNSFCLLVCATEEICLNFKTELQKVNVNCEVLVNLPSVNLSSFNYEMDKFNTVLINLLNGNLECLIVTPEVLKQKIVNINKFKQSFLYLETGTNVNFENFKQSLITSGIKKVDVVNNKNEFSVHGDILNVFLKTENNPIKISFFDDEVESINYYDLETGKKTFSCDSILLSLGNWFNFTEEEKENLKQKLNLYKTKFANREAEENWKAQVENACFEIDNNKANHNFFTPFVSNANCNIINFLPKDAIICYNEPKQILSVLESSSKTLQNEINNYIEDGSLVKEHFNAYFKNAEIFKDILKFTNLAFQAITTNNNIFKPNKVFSFICLPKITYNKKYNLLAEDCRRLLIKHVTIIIYAKELELAKIIEKHLNAKNCECNIIDNLSKLQPGSCNIVTKEDNISVGLIEENLVIIGSYDVFATKKVVKAKEKNTFNEQFLPKVNDYVVHEVHGVGKYLGVQKLTFSNVERDYALIEYKNSDKLYLPIENLNLVSKYVGGEGAPKLNKIGGEDFAKTVNKVRGSVKELAFNLAKLYAERQNKKPNEYVLDDEIQDAFESAFKYDETPDQLKAIADVKNDMLSNKIMDRLICGDVGYGKTEVAMRAMFKCVMSGYQVAFLCPTTILSEQHYLTLINRMKSFGVSCEVLNRFKTPKQQQKILEDVKNGKVDILIGTHRLLSQDVVIPKLAMLVLDEEQRFGVSDKEKIKNIKKNIDVLTLSATPIPRTLNLSLVGIRDISVIETPPPNRIEASVSVTEYSDMLLKNAIEKELDRDGQVLVVYNNVKNIYKVKSHIQSLINKDVAIGVAHGQMNEIELENEIFKLYNNQTQILVSTTLIENGVDLPNANTLIVIDADKLGLSQLYQLKGRVGRSDRQAYAYFTFNKQKALSEDAFKRLSAISEFTSFGSGFKIAMRDLEIRGAGSLLGANQHGHLEKVGYAMYVKLLQEAVSETCGKEKSSVSDVKINTKFKAFIPDNLIKQESTRIEFYSKISKLQTVEELNNFLNKFNDMFVVKSVPVENLAIIATIKNICAKLNAKEVKIFDDLEIVFAKENLENCVKCSNVLQNLEISNSVNVQNLPTLQVKNCANSLINCAEITEKILEEIKKQ